MTGTLPVPSGHEWEQGDPQKSPLWPAALEGHPHPVTLLAVPQPPPQASLLDSKGGHQNQSRHHHTPCCTHPTSLLVLNSAGAEN